MRVLLIPMLLALTGCEPKFANVTIDGVPVCPGSKLEHEVVVKIDGPRASVMQRLDGRTAGFAARLQQGKEYEVKAYKCSSDPCEAQANLIGTQKLTAPEAETGNLAISIKGFPACEPLAPPPAPAEPAPTPEPQPAGDAAPDAG